MVLWETKFWALSQTTGRLEERYGMFVKAEDLIKATAYLRSNKDFDYLQLTGHYYESLESFERIKEFEEKLEEVETPLSSMTFDDFYDWLKKAPTIEDLLLVRDRVIQEGGMDEYIPLIDKLIKEYGEKESGEEDTN